MLKELALRAVEMPADAVEVASVQGVWGIKGWLRLHPYSPDPEALFHARLWFLAPPQGCPAGGFEAYAGTVEVTVCDIKMHGDKVLARLEQVTDRDGAEALRGARIFISRSQFPQTSGADEYYWIDLIGMQVVNRAGVHLGVVRDLLPTGPHCVLCLEYEVEGKLQERLLPFVAAYVDAVDQASGRITVDWQPDY